MQRKVKEIMSTLNAEVNKLVRQLKDKQKKFEAVLKNQTWLEDARKFAEKGQRDVRKLLGTDLKRVRSFIEKERKQIEQLQRRIPGEIQKAKTFVTSQRKELQRLLQKVQKAATKKSLRRGGGKGKKTASNGS